MPKRAKFTARSLAARVALVALWSLLATAGFMLWPNSFGGSTGYVIVSGKSMLPTYETGDLLITRERQTFTAGQVIVYDVPRADLGAGMSVVHRVVRGSVRDGWTTKGDNNRSADPWNPHLGDVRGAVVLRIRHGGTALLWVRSPISFALLGGIVVGGILWPAATNSEAGGDSTGHGRRKRSRTKSPKPSQPK